MTDQQLREKLRHLYARGRGARKIIDEFLGQHEADQKTDLKRLLACANESQLRLLQDAILEGRVLRLAYRRSTPKGDVGCIVGLLFGHRSTDDLIDHDYPDHETFLAANRIVRAWDYNELSIEALTIALEEALQVIQGAMQKPISIFDAKSHAPFSCMLASTT